LIERLRLLAAAGPEAANVQSYDHEFKVLTVGDAQQEARLELFDYDRYSVSLRALAIGYDAPAPQDAHAYLSATAAEIARRLSYLEEPLAVWELDAGERFAQLRSSPPQREGTEIYYWEVTLSIGLQPGARIMRYRWTPGMVEREAIPYPAAFAMIGRIADSLGEGLRIAGE
jgi:hypothetical protein